MINLILQERVSNFKFITAKFAGSKQAYTYKTDLELSSGDFIVVEAPSGLTVVTVDEAFAEVVESPKFAIKWVVAKVDTQHYKDMVKVESHLTANEAAMQTGVARL
jgi:hypothetical protein